MVARRGCPSLLKMEVLRRSSRRVAQEISSKKNVAFMTLGHKRIKGERTGQRALVVYVLKKEGVAAGDRIPPQIAAVHGDGRRVAGAIPTDVVEIHGRPRTFGARAGDVLISSDGKQGVCGFVFSKGGTGYLLTNAHVGCDMANGGNPTTISVVDPPTGCLVQVGPVVWSSGLSPLRIATDDSAVARADFISVDPAMISGLSAAVAGEGYLTPSAPSYWYMVNGARFECGNPEQVTYPAGIDVDGIQIQYRGFWVLQMVRGAVGPGHSGSLLCRDGPSGPVACGMVFGGSAPTQVFAFSFKPSFDNAYSAVA